LYGLFPKTQKLYLQEVSALTDVLFRVEKAIQEAESTGLHKGSSKPVDSASCMAFSTRKSTSVRAETSWRYSFLVQIAGQITKLSYSYVSDIKSAPKTQKLYLQEVLYGLFHPKEHICEG
jgi:hypothetical protein